MSPRFGTWGKWWDSTADAAGSFSLNHDTLPPKNDSTARSNPAAPLNRLPIRTEATQISLYRTRR